jgi:hypothetical protein
VYKKRSTNPVLADEYSGLPKELQNIAISLASVACKCYLEPLAPKTITITRTATAGATTTVFSTLLATVPSTTSTLAAIETVSSIIYIAVTDTQYTIFTETASTTTTSTVTSLSTVTPPVPTQTFIVPVSYSAINLLRNDCAYNRYYHYSDEGISNDPANNYQQGVRECQALCTGEPVCNFFFVLHFDPSKARGYDATVCLLDTQPYDASNLQCGYVNNFNVAYNKN